MYHRSDSCIQLGVMNLWFPPLNNMTLSVCFGPPLGTPVFHSCPTKCWCYIILYPVNYILYPMICFFFLWWNKSASIPKSSSDDWCIYSILPRWDQQFSVKISTAFSKDSSCTRHSKQFKTGSKTFRDQQLVVDLPLWKMMEFVSWGHYSQYMEK